MTAYRFFGSVVFALVACVACFGQSSFQGITPGASTRGDVERVLGRPARSISVTLFEYNPPTGVAKVEVEYGAGSAAVERLEVYFARPISRAALIQKLGLPPQADARRANAEGRLMEYFGGASLLALTYAAADVGSGVSQIGYYSRQLFAATVATAGGKTAGASNLALPLNGATAKARPGSTVAADTVLIVQMIKGITSKNAQPGDVIRASVIAPVSVNGIVIIPAGAVVEGQVTQVIQAKRMSRPGMIAVDFNQLVFADGSRFPIIGTLTSANPEERSKIDREGRVSRDGNKRAVVFIGGAAGAGAAIGAISSGGKAAAVGSAAGVAAGVAATMLMKGPEAEIKTGLQFGIQLSQPLVVP